MLVSRMGGAEEALPRSERTIQPISTVTFSKRNYLEILPVGVNKAKAVAALSKFLSVDLSEVAAIGDGLNDLEMLSEAGFAIAMGNASGRAKPAPYLAFAPNNHPAF